MKTMYVLVGYDSWNGDEEPVAIETHLDEEKAQDRLNEFRSACADYQKSLYKRSRSSTVPMLSDGTVIEFYPGFALLSVGVPDRAS